MMITSQIQNTHLKPKCVQPPVTGKQFQCFDFNVYKHEMLTWSKYRGSTISLELYVLQTNTSIVHAAVIRK